jgi:hypothetical protein
MTAGTAPQRPARAGVRPVPHLFFGERLGLGGVEHGLDDSRVRQEHRRLAAGRAEGSVMVLEKAVRGLTDHFCRKPQRHQWLRNNTSLKTPENPDTDCHMEFAPGPRPYFVPPPAAATTWRTWGSIFSRATPGLPTKSR